MVAGPSDIGVVALKEWDSRDFSAYNFWLYFCFYIDSINSKWIILLMDIINKNNNMVNPSGEAVRFYNANIRLTVLVDVSWIIRDLED